MSSASPPTVRRVALSPSGPALSALVAGVWRLASWEMDVGARVRWIEECLALGITSFDLAVNLKTAQQIGVTIPPEVLQRAVKVIK